MARIIDSNEKNLIGSNLKILRKQKKMSQQELSGHSSSSYSYSMYP